MVVHAYNSSPQKAETGGSRAGQTGLHRETKFQTTVIIIIIIAKLKTCEYSLI
jgi:hypothetical protein